MNNKFLKAFIFFQLFLLILGAINLNITRTSRYKKEKTSNLTPFLVALSSEDQFKKKTNVDLICIIDVSGSMYGPEIDLVKESLKSLVKLMNEEDQLALVPFSHEVDTSNIFQFHKMSSENKELANSYIGGLKASGGTSIDIGLEAGLDLLTNDYSDGNRIASMILLSDGGDYYSVIDTFKQYIKDKNKENYLFTLHSFGYGDSHDSRLMNDISKIRNGGYFFIHHYSMVQSAFVEIYGSLSTIKLVNQNLVIKSPFQIKKYLGVEDGIVPENKEGESVLTINIPHFVYGKLYDFVILLDITTTPNRGDEVLTATFDTKTFSYKWNDEDYNSQAYESYIKYIVVQDFDQSYTEANTGAESAAKNIINDGIEWIKIKDNYDGKKDWVKEYNKVLEDLNIFTKYGKASLLSKIRELKYLKLGSNYNDENSYQKKLIDESYEIEVNSQNCINITQEQNISDIYFDENRNQYKFTLIRGKGYLNGLHFSEEKSSILINSKENITITAKSISNEDMEICYILDNNKENRIQNEVNFFKGMKFIYNRDFPLEFYTEINSIEDITFNIQFLELENEPIEGKIKHDIEIKGYIVDGNILSNPDSRDEFQGYYDGMHRVGKLVIRDKDIEPRLQYNYKNYLYIIIQKKGDYDIKYNKIIGQLSFISMDHISLDVPEGFYIFSNLPEEEKAPHKYRFNLEPNIGKITRIEFQSSGKELNCSVIKYQNDYLPQYEGFYKDEEEFNIKRSENWGKYYIDITTEEMDLDEDEDPEIYKYVVLTIYSTNGGHETGSEQEKLSYLIRYTTSSNYGIYSYNDTQNTNGQINIENDNDKRIIKFYPLKSKNENDEDFTNELTRFFIKLYKMNKPRQNTYKSISLFEYSFPIDFKELEIKDESQANFEFQVNKADSYFFTLFTVSRRSNEILSYGTGKIPKDVTNYEITDEQSFEEEFNEEKDINFKINENTNNKFLMVKISDFDEGKFGTLEATFNEQYYKSVQPTTTNYLLIPTEECEGKTVTIKTGLKDGENTWYYLTLKLTDKLELIVGEKASIEINNEILKDITVILKNSDDSDDKATIFIQSTKGDFVLKNLDDLLKNEAFGAYSGEIVFNNKNKEIEFTISSELGDFITISSHFISSDKKKISNYELNYYGILSKDEKCIYLNENLTNIEKYQVRILGDKNINVKYNSTSALEYVVPGTLYMKLFTQYVERVCISLQDIMETAFYSLQIIDTTKQQKSTDILLPVIMDYLYTDILDNNEVRYYTQGIFDPEPSNDLEYLYNVKQVKGEIKVYKAQCENFPYCQYDKEFLEDINNNVEEINNIDDYFIYSQKANEFNKYDSKNIFVTIILCLSDSCEYNFIIKKSNSLIKLSGLEKFSTKINENKIHKFSVTPSQNYEIISIDLYTHTGELELSTNENCKNIKHIIFGNLEKIEIPKTCEIKNDIEIYVQANMDSVYSIEYKNIENTKLSKIKSNIVHMEYIEEEKNIEFTPIKDSYFIKFIPINCEINVKYEINGVKKNVPYLQNIYYYDSDSEVEKIYKFNITTENTECMIYTYIEELDENYYSILSDQVPYYLSLNKIGQTYKLLYPIPNANYAPMLKINIFEEIPLKVNYSINGKYDDEISALFSKEIIPSNELLGYCPNDEICYLTLEIKYDKEHENPILLEILPKSNNEIPALLFDNIMKQDFIKLNGEQQYMTKILKDEEGEVSFNYKHFSGELIANLINIDKHSWKNRYYLPEQNEQLIYDKLKQKIIFTKKETNKCTNGCYLFIEVHTFDNFINGKNDLDLTMDYSIYLKKSDKMLNLKLNEYIMGTLLDVDNYIEYYSIKITYSTNKLYIDYSSENTIILMNDNNIKPTKENFKYGFTSKGFEQIFEIENKGEDFKDKTFIIGIYTTKLENGISHYSIRIRAENILYQKYIYSDSNTNNLCENNINNLNCYFIIPISHIQKNADILFFAKSLENYDDIIINYKKINLISDNDDDIYSHTSSNQFIKNMLLIKNEDLPQTENENILIKIETKSVTTINLLYTYNSGLNENLLSPNNKILYSVEHNKELYLTIPNSVRSLIHFEVISGKGSIGYEYDEKSMTSISGKHSSMFLQSTENNQNKRIKIKASDTSDFYFYAYIKLDSEKRNINEINNGNALIQSGQGFPIEFYSKITLNDYIINFNIENLKENPDPDIDIVSTFTLKAYIVQEEIIEKLNNDETYVYYPKNNNQFIGKYEPGFGIAKLEISKKDISKYYYEEQNNYIYLIIKSSDLNPIILKDIQGQVTVLPKNDINYPLPENTYINGKLASGTNSIKYKLIKKNSDDKKIRIELSANSLDIEYKISYDEELLLGAIDYTEIESLGKKYIDINLLEVYDSIIFEIIYKGETYNTTEDISYTLRYRTDEGNIVFKNYTQDEDVIVNEIKEETNETLKYKKIEIIIPAIKEADTGKNIEGNYYLKIYERENDTDYINGTISVVDNIEPYKVYEFKIEKENYTKILEIPNDKNDYYIIISAVTNDKELLSYKKPILIEYKEEEEEDTSDIEDTTDIHDDSSDYTDIYDDSSDYTDYTDGSDDITNTTDSNDNETDSTYDTDASDSYDTSDYYVDTDTDMSDNTDSSDKTDNTDSTDKTDSSDNTDKTDGSDSTDKTDSSDSTDKTDIHDDTSDNTDALSDDTSDNSDNPDTSKTDIECEDCSSFKEENDSLIIVIIVISIICFLLILIIIHMALKLRGNKIEDSEVRNERAIPLTESNQVDN